MQTFSQLSAIQQLQVKREVSALLSEGKGYKKIRRIFTQQGIKLSLGTLSYWCNIETKRLRKNSFTAKPSKELAYFIGVLFGDGCASIDKKNHDYCLQLSSIDKEFVEKFSICVSKLLGKEKNYPVHRSKHIFTANIRSKELYQFVKEIKNDFEKAKPFIESGPVEFIQGLADSEGHPTVSAAKEFKIKVTVANSANLALLQYTQDLLIKFFNIKSTSRLTKRAGVTDSVIEGRKITRTKNVYLVETQTKTDTKKYYEKIGFNIYRKQQKLQYAIQITETYSIKQQQKEWTKKYIKVGKQWQLKPVQEIVQKAP